MTETPRLSIPESIRPDNPWAANDPMGNVHPHPSLLRQPAITHRHSRFVRAMKLLLPAIAAMLIALVVTWPQLQRESGRFSMGYAVVESSGNMRPHMVNARFTGIDDDNQPFSLTSDSATQIGDSPEIVALENPQADISLADGSWVAISAESGVYSETNHILGLRGEVNLYHDAGYEFHTESADIDVAAVTASGGAPVFGQGPFGRITSQGFILLKRGKRIIFTGQSHLVIHSNAMKSGK